MNIEGEEQTNPAESDGFECVGGGASAFSIFPSRPSRGRRWISTDDMVTDTPSQSRQFWSALGMRAPSPMASPSSRLTDANRVPNPMRRIDPAFLSPGDGVQQQSIHLSSRLPRRVWIILAKCLGIKLRENDKPIISTALHMLTITAALSFALPGMWYTIFDIHSEYSKTTVLLGTVQIIIGLAWTCLGVYAHNLSGRLFFNKNFVECVRVHSKTFLKISTTWLTIFLGTGIMVVNCYVASSTFFDDTCGNIQIEILVCQVFFVGRVSYAVLTLLWNFIVIYVVFSVCRTHTVGIRQLMRELDTDARWYEDFCLKQYHIQRGGVGETLNNLEDSWYLWEDSGNRGREDDANQQHGVFLRSVNASCHSNFRTLSTSLQSLRYRRRSSNLSATLEDGGGEETGNGGGSGGGGTERGREVKDRHAKPRLSIQEEEEEGCECDGGDEHEEEYLQSEEGGDKNNVKSLLTNEDLLFTYWKFIRRLSVTSRYLQRWLASWIVFVVMWDGYFIIFWTSHAATLTDILQFIVPLIILLLVCSAYAEVNAEGQRLLKTICPYDERLPVVYYFNQYPLTVGVFSIPVTYNTMVTAILAFSVAFASRMILDEIRN
ncbi:uncharacterized protein LOC143288860 [Babylonia areolata]|uniref:uncharacterized protein LOC143288860 n=1 Tax=Babylonia areolata TaxID=304850 RepID=UPI003FD137F9